MPEEQKLFAGGRLASSKIPSLHLIPTVGIERLADRFQLGMDRKGDKAWNALTSNQDCLLDRDLLIERLGHVIHHALKLRDKVVLEKEFGGAEQLFDEDDDAGAIAWGGIFAICSTQAIKEENV